MQVTDTSAATLVVGAMAAAAAAVQTVGPPRAAAVTQPLATVGAIATRLATPVHSAAIRRTAKHRTSHATPR